MYIQKYHPWFAWVSGKPGTSAISVHIQWCSSFVKTTSKVTTTHAARATQNALFSQCLRSVSCREKTNQNTGPGALPKYFAFNQKVLLSSVTLDNSMT